MLYVGCCLQPKERDRVEGGWYAYHPVGGAITVLTKDTVTKGPAAKGSGSSHETVQHSTLLAGSADQDAGRNAGRSTASPAAARGSDSVSIKIKARGPVIEVMSSSTGGSKTAATAAKRDTSLLKP